MSSTLYDLLPDVEKIKEVVTQVRAGHAYMINITGGSHAGKTQLLDAVRTHWLTEQDLIIEIDLLDYEAATPILLIAALAPLIDQFLLTSEFVQYCKKELIFKLRPYHNLLKQALPKFYDEVIGVKTRNDAIHISEEATFRIVLELLREVLGAEVPLFILIDHFEKAPSSFVQLISDLSVSHLGILVSTSSEKEIETPSLALYEFPHYQSIYINLDELTTEKILFALNQWPLSQLWPSGVLELIAAHSRGKLAVAIRLSQKIHALLSNGILLNADMNTWTFTLEQLNAQPDRLTSLSRGEKNILALATPFISSFGAIELSSIADKNLDLVNHILALAVDQDILKISGVGSYRFQYEEDKKQLELLLEDRQKETIKKKLFEWMLQQDIFLTTNSIHFLLPHLSEFIQHYPVKQVIFTLKLACDHCHAQRDILNLVIFLKAILSIPLEPSWFTDNAKILELFNELANLSLLAKDWMLTRELCQKIYTCVPAIEDHSEAIEAEIKALLSAKSYESANVLAIRYVSQLGYKISTHVSYGRVIFLWLHVLLLIRRNAEHGYILRSNTEKNSLAIARVLKAISTVAYVNTADKMFLPALILLGIRWALERGVGPGTMYAIYGYQLIKYVVREQYPIFFNSTFLQKAIDKSYQSIPMTQYNEIEKACFDDEFYESRTLFTHAAFIAPFTKSLQDSVAGLLSSYEVGLLAGSWEFASYSSSVAAWYFLCGGHPLQGVLDSIAERYETVKLFGYEAAIFNHLILKNFTLDITDPERATHPLSSMREGVSRNSDFLLNFARAWQCVLQDNYLDGLKFCKKTLSFMDGGLGLPLCPYLYLFYIYCLIMVKKEKGHGFAIAYRVKFYLKRLAIWSTYNKRDFSAHEQLGQALYAWLEGEKIKSTEYILEMLDEESEVNNHYLRALACELYVKISQSEDSNITQKMLEACQDSYAQWGYSNKIIIERNGSYGWT